MSVVHLHLIQLRVRVPVVKKAAFALALEVLVLAPRIVRQTPVVDTGIQFVCLDRLDSAVRLQQGLDSARTGTAPRTLDQARAIVLCEAPEDG